MYGCFAYVYLHHVSRCCWESNLCSLEDYPVCLIAEPSLREKTNESILKGGGIEEGVGNIRVTCL